MLCKIFRIFVRFVYFALAFAFLCYASILAYEWLIPWYFDIMGTDFQPDSLYKKNNNMLPTPKTK